MYIRDGGLLSYVLIGLSVVALALIIRNLFVLRRGQFAPPRVVSAVEGMLAAGRVVEAERFLRTPENRCFLSTVMIEALARCRAKPTGLADFRAAAEEVAREEADEVHRMNDGIGILAAVGPMLGLLGTVIGMIGAFRTIGTLQGAARSNELAVYMSMALVSTAEGLIVAIPCTIAFALFRRRIDRLVQRVGRDLERFSSLLATGGPSASGAGPRMGVAGRQAGSVAGSRV
jgi:biopolymer transport protein ExbB